MDDSSEGGDQRASADTPQPQSERAQQQAAPAVGVGSRTGSTSVKPSGHFVGQAMKSLFESADVSIRRDDETRVMSRAQDALADLQRRRGSVEDAPSATDSLPPRAPTSSAPPGPRVDVVLWVVLAAGLFAIAGWMLLYGL